MKRKSSGIGRIIIFSFVSYFLSTPKKVIFWITVDEPACDCYSIAHSHKRETQNDNYLFRVYVDFGKYVSLNTL